LPEIKSQKSGGISITLPPGAAFCLSPTAQPLGLSGDAYRRAREQAAWAIQALSENFSVGELDHCDWRKLAEIVERSPFDFLAAIRHLDSQTAQRHFHTALEKAFQQSSFPQ